MFIVKCPILCVNINIVRVGFFQTCQINLEGQPFFAKAGKPYCKQHAR